MTDWRARRILEHRTTSLSFAFGLVDGFTGDRPPGDVRVTVTNVDVDPVVNPAGYYLFLDLDVDRVDLAVDGGDTFFDAERTVVFEDADPDGSTVVVTDPSEPVVVELEPTPAYPYPDSATMVRGHVRDDDGAGIADARVSLETFGSTARTTETGEFALPVPAGPDAVASRDGERLVSVNGHDDGNGTPVGSNGHWSDPTLSVRLPSGETHTQTVRVRPGVTTVAHVDLQ